MTKSLCENVRVSALNYVISGVRSDRFPNIPSNETAKGKERKQSPRTEGGEHGPSISLRHGDCVHHTIFMTFPPSLLHTDETCSLQQVCRLSKVTINTVKYSVNYLVLEI